MPNLGDMIQQTVPAYAGSVLPYVGTAKIKTDKGDVAYGPNGIFGPQNAGQAYVDFLNKLEIEKQMSPLSRDLEQLKTTLATDINQRFFKMDPKTAERMAHTFSAGSLAASAILLQNDAPKIMKTLENTLVQAGVVSPTVADRDFRRGISVKNRQIESFMKQTLNMLLNPAYTRRMGAVSNTEMAQLISARFLNGEYNHIMSTPGYFAPNGNLSDAGKQTITQHILELSKVAETAKQIFNAPALKSIDMLNDTMGTNLIKDIGEAETDKLLKDIVSHGTASGVQPQELQGILKQVAHSYRQEGKPIQDALPAVRDFVAMQGAGKGLPNSPGESEGILNFVKEMNQGPFANLEAASFAALSKIYGASKADRIINKASDYAVKAKDTDTYKNYQTSFMNYVNGELSPSSQLSEDTVDVYLRTPEAQRYLSTGKGSKQALRQLSNSVVEARKQLVTSMFPTLDVADRTKLKRARFSDDAIRQLHKSKFYATPIERLKAEQAVKDSLDSLAKQHGFEKSEQTDRLLQMINDPDKLQAIQSYAHGKNRIEDVLSRKGKGSLQESVMSGPPTLQGILSGVTKDTNLTPEDIATAHQVPQKKREGLNSILNTWFAPNSASAPIRETASRYLERM